jgi:malate dehydrogenase (oxaloacetate-decarboxylating)(NADP+)
MVQTARTQPSDTLRGIALLDDPIRNKGTAFTSEERRRSGLEGLLPHAVENLDRQVERVMEHLDAKPNDLERYIYLIGLSDRKLPHFRSHLPPRARYVRHARVVPFVRLCLDRDLACRGLMVAGSSSC